MGISQKTVDIINENRSKFTAEVQGSTQKLINLAQQNSPLSDINFLIKKNNEKIPGVIISAGDTSWVPIRNVIRIIGKIADSSLLEIGKVKEIEIQSMFAGCDYFKGTLSCTSDIGKQTSGEYKWQWTSFHGYDRNYNKFTLFPQNWVDLEENKNKITA